MYVIYVTRYFLNCIIISHFILSFDTFVKKIYTEQDFNARLTV